MASKNVTLRIPDKLLDRLEQVAAIDYPSLDDGRRVNRSQVILDALTVYVSERLGATSPLEERVKKLEEKLEKLEKQTLI